jgi:sterol desaturase/sphingolipid hydroxylase (fatty acid hydroxylase superfamily)
MHRVHHSVNPLEANSNFGFNLPWWDFLAGTYRAQPAEGHEAMRLGIPELGPIRDASLPVMLVMPFLSKEAPLPAASAATHGDRPVVGASV